MPKARKRFSRHRLLVYYRLGQRWRTAPFFTALVGILLYGIGWLGHRSLLQGGNLFLLQRLWEARLFIVLLIAASIILYALMILISRTSYVQVRPKALRIRAGLLTLDISYGRIKQLRLVNLQTYHPVEKLRGSEYALVEPFLEQSCTAVDLSSWPVNPKLLKTLWSKFLFTDGNGLLLIVDDPMQLNQEIDAVLSYRHARRSKRGMGYKDPIERAVQAGSQSRRRWH